MKKGRPKKGEVRVPTTRKWTPTKVTPIIQEILHRKTLGQSNKVIAEAVGKSPQWVGLVTRSPLFKLELGRMLEKRAGQYTDIQKEAMEVDARVRSLDSIGTIAQTAEKDSTRLEAYKTILDRAYGKVTQPVALQIGFQVPDEFIRHAADVFMEQRQVIDVTPVSDEH